MKALQLITVSSLFALLGCSQPVLKPLAKDNVILCFGDSLTYGTGTDASNSYPTVLATLAGRTVVNAGKPGETSQEGLSRLPAVLEKETPSLVVLCHGGNDILQRLDYTQTKKNLAAMVTLCRERELQVVLIAVPSVLSDAHPLYAEVAKETHVPIENLVLGKLIRNDDYKSDQVHLNKAGYTILAEAVYSLLKTSGAL